MPLLFSLRWFSSLRDLGIYNDRLVRLHTKCISLGDFVFSTVLSLVFTWAKYPGAFARAFRWRTQRRLHSFLSFLDGRTVSILSWERSTRMLLLLLLLLLVATLSLSLYLSILSPIFSFSSIPSFLNFYSPFSSRFTRSGVTVYCTSTTCPKYE